MKRICLLLIGILCIFGSSAFATDRYADDNGADTTHVSCTAVQTGTGACTLAHALTVMQGGDTLILGDGTYSGNICSGTVPSGTAGFPTTIRAANAKQAILAPSSGCSSIVIWISNRSYITISGLDATCTNQPGGCQVYYITDGSHHIIIENGIARDGQGLYGQGIEIQSTGSPVTHDVTVRNMIIHDNGMVGCSSQFTAHGIYMQTDHNLVENNELYSNPCGYGITLYHTAGNAHDNIIRNNYVHDHPNFGVDIVAFSAGANNLVYNNIIADNARGIEVGGSNTGIYHNVMYSNDQYCMFVRSGGNSVQLENNICLSNGNGAIVDQGTTTTCLKNLNVGSTGDGCTTTQGSANPFINAAGGNFHLTADDNGGVFIGAAPLDKDNVSRTEPTDRGAYEFAGSGVTAGASIFGTRFIR